jgi:hypothetical protein
MFGGALSDYVSLLVFYLRNPSKWYHVYKNSTIRLQDMKYGHYRSNTLKHICAVAIGSLFRFPISSMLNTINKSEDILTTLSYTKPGACHEMFVLSKFYPCLFYIYKIERGKILRGRNSAKIGQSQKTSAVWFYIKDIQKVRFFTVSIRWFSL